jgi:hypothetical protein
VDSGAFALELLLPEIIILPAGATGWPHGPVCRLSSFPKNRTCQMPIMAKTVQDVDRKSMSIEGYDFALG